MTIERPEPGFSNDEVGMLRSFIDHSRATIRLLASGLRDAQLDRLCLDNIGRYKRPRKYFYMDALPKNNYGKVLKTTLRAMVAAAPAQA